MTQIDKQNFTIAKKIPSEYWEFVISVATKCSKYNYDSNMDTLFDIYYKHLPNKYLPKQKACIDCRGNVKIEMIRLTPYLSKLLYEKKLLDSIGNG